MGCSTSSQTSAADTTRPSSKPEESNGASTTGATGDTQGAANENGNVTEDGETIPEQMPPQDGEANPAGEPVVAATSAGGTAAAPPTGEVPEPAAASSETPETAASSPEPAAAATEQEAEAAAAESNPTTDAAPAPSE